MKRPVAGVDIGSTTSKAVVMNAECTKILSHAIIDTQFDRNASGVAALDAALAPLGAERGDLSAVGATGYGRRAFELATYVSPEVICHGIGTDFFVPGVRTIFDVGGQDSKIIQCGPGGAVVRFEMNDKCAAGTGRFFEVLSRRLLNVPIDELGPLALSSTDPIRLSSTCTIFAESEIVSLLSQGVKPADICKGILISTEKRIISIARGSSVPLDDPIVLTGGLARNEAAAPTFEDLLEKTVHTVEIPQLPAAVGVAIKAQRELG